MEPVYAPNGAWAGDSFVGGHASASDQRVIGFTPFVFLRHFCCSPPQSIQPISPNVIPECCYRESRTALFNVLDARLPRLRISGHDIKSKTPPKLPALTHRTSGSNQRSLCPTFIPTINAVDYILTQSFSDALQSSSLLTLVRTSFPVRQFQYSHFDSSETP